MFGPRENMSFKSVSDKIDEKAKDNFVVMSFSAGFNESNYECDMKILTALYTNNHPTEHRYTDEARNEVKKMGQMIHDRGGKTAMQANFYIMCNFMDFNDEGNHKMHMSSLADIWNGVGEWISTDDFVEYPSPKYVDAKDFLRIHG